MARTRRTVVYLSHRNEALERSTGTVWSAEGHAEVKRLTGVDDVAPVELLSRQTFNAMLRGPRPVALCTRSARRKVRRRAATRSSAIRPVWPPIPGTDARRARRTSSACSTPATRRSNAAWPPILDALRQTKSRAKSRCRHPQGVGTGGPRHPRGDEGHAPHGVFEYQVAAAARFVFLANGARFELADCRRRPTPGWGTTRGIRTR